MKEKRSVANSQLPDPETWVDQYGDYLYRYALFRVQDPATAEDVVHETFLVALQTREGFEGRSSVRTWLTGILKHKIIDHFRRESREQRVDNIETVLESMDALFDETGQWKVRPTEWNANPRKLLEQKEFWKVLNRCLAELPVRLAQAFMLREMGGLSREEICNVLRISATNYWVILYRARMHLRRCLEINWFGAKPLGSP